MLGLASLSAMAEGALRNAAGAGLQAHSVSPLRTTFEVWLNSIYTPLPCSASSLCPARLDRRDAAQCRLGIRPAGGDPHRNQITAAIAEKTSCQSVRQTKTPEQRSSGVLQIRPPLRPRVGAVDDRRPHVARCGRAHVAEAEAHAGLAQRVAALALIADLARGHKIVPALAVTRATRRTEGMQRHEVIDRGRGSPQYAQR